MKPNILIIHADQHRYDCLGCYGNPEIRTPAVDRLARDGVRFTGSFCSFPACTPSRYSLLNGLYPHQHLGWTNRSTQPPALPTFPRTLRENGYRTAAVGKMHFTPTYLDLGFEEMLLAEQDGPGRYDDDYHRYLRERGLVDALDLVDQVREYRDRAPEVYRETFGALRSDLPEEHHSTTWIGERALERLRGWSGTGSEPRDGGNLLMVGFIKPHHPFDPPAPWDTLYDPQKLTLLPGWTASLSPEDRSFHAGYFPHESLSASALRRVMAYYYATISQIDAYVGKMIETLEQAGLYRDTLIIYTSDHGEYMGYHHLLLKGSYMYEPLVRVPLIVKYPGNRDAGTVSDALVSNTDLAPTIVRQAGCPVPGTMRGLDLAADRNGHEAVFCEHSGGSQYMVRTRERKLILCRDPQRSRFFDLSRDPCETDDLIRDPARAGEVAEHIRILSDWLIHGATTPDYRDESAPVIRGGNVPARGDGHAEDAERWFREQMHRRGEGTASPSGNI